MQFNLFHLPVLTFIFFIKLKRSAKLFVFCIRSIYDIFNHLVLCIILLHLCITLIREKGGVGWFSTWQSKLSFLLFVQTEVSFIQQNSPLHTQKPTKVTLKKNNFIELISASRHFLLQISLRKLMAIWYRIAKRWTQEHLIHL